MTNENCIPLLGVMWTWNKHLLCLHAVSLMLRQQPLHSHLTVNVCFTKLVLKRAIFSLPLTSYHGPFTFLSFEHTKLCQNILNELASYLNTFNPETPILSISLRWLKFSLSNPEYISVYISMILRTQRTKGWDVTVATLPSKFMCLLPVMQMPSLSHSEYI